MPRGSLVRCLPPGHPPGLLSCLASGLLWFGLIGQAQPSEQPAFHAAEGLFDASNTATLGLQHIDAEHSLLYQANADGYKFCHHPNLVVFHDTLYCMWSNGLVDEDAAGQRILYSRTSDGHTWSRPEVLTDDRNGQGICVAVGFHVSEDEFVAYYTVTAGENFHPDTALFAKTSADGRNWSESRRVTGGFFIEAPVPVRDGRLLLAGEHVGDDRRSRRMRLLYTDDHRGLRGWQQSRIDPPDLSLFGYTEPSFFRSSADTVNATFRNYSGHLYASASSDNGQTWSVPTPTNFPDSTARTSAGNLPDGTAYLINNPLPKQFDRSLLTIALSRDGETFDRAYLIRSKPTQRRYDGKSKLDGWQYPNAVVWKDQLFVAYSINKEDVAASRISIENLSPTRASGTNNVRQMKSKLRSQQKLMRGAATQGLALTPQHYFTSTAGSIYRYDTQWKLLEEKPIRIEGVDHVGAIDYHEGYLWAGLLRGPSNGKHDPSLDRSVIAKIRAADLEVEQTWDITHDVSWIDPVCFDGRYLWVGDLSDLGIHRYRLADGKLVRDGVLRYPKEMHFSQGIRVRGRKLYSMHTFGSMDGLFQFELPESLGNGVLYPSRVWQIKESQTHLEGFDFVPGQNAQIWHAQGKQVDRYELSGIDG